ncbi:MAG: hypothetical protein JW915_13400 [Chitinispirillaceae bacterium]|nr:hypothetical protein [Chitinispirillaceae bacterium]
MNNSSLTLLPFLHGRLTFARQLRALLLKKKFDCIAVDIPEIFESELIGAVEKLPVIWMVYAQSMNGETYYVPVDPCDAAIEGMRQGLQNNVNVCCVGYGNCSRPPTVGILPDDFAAEKIGFNRFNTLALMSIGNKEDGSSEDIESRYIAQRLLDVKTKFNNVLALIHYRHYVRVVAHLGREETCNAQFNSVDTYTIDSKAIYPDHLYFAIGELPFTTGKYEKQRLDIFAEPFDIIDTVKDLFRETRDDYSDDKSEIQALSPTKIKAALTFLRNLTVMSGRLIPTLPDIIDAARGVGGNTYALRILKNAKYYPFISFDSESVKVGIDRIVIPGSDGPLRAINLFRDFDLEWRTISIRPDPSLFQKKRYRFGWNPYSMCSHVPEDIKIERFNSYIRQKTVKVLVEDYVKTEKFATSVKDGIDIRETLRNWSSGSVYVKEIPPSRGKVDTVVIIFDQDHDEQYPHHTTWYAEHDDESTLTFYATSAFENMVGPGIAKCYYGGLSLMFPPRHVPDIFQITADYSFPDLASRLAFGAMLFSNENVISYVAARKPGTFLKNLASKHKKHLLWIPLSTFSSETIAKIRRFHILNGKIVRSWAQRFIGD